MRAWKLSVLSLMGLNRTSELDTYIKIMKSNKLPKLRRAPYPGHINQIHHCRQIYQIHIEDGPGFIQKLEDKINERLSKTESQYSWVYTYIKHKSILKSLDGIANVEIFLFRNMFEVKRAMELIEIKHLHRS